MIASINGKPVPAKTEYDIQKRRLSISLPFTSVADTIRIDIPSDLCYSKNWQRLIYMATLPICVEGLQCINLLSLMMKAPCPFHSIFCPSLCLIESLKTLSASCLSGVLSSFWTRLVWDWPPEFSHSSKPIFLPKAVQLSRTNPMAMIRVAKLLFCFLLLTIVFPLHFTRCFHYSKNALQNAECWKNLIKSWNDRYFLQFWNISVEPVHRCHDIFGIYRNFLRPGSIFFRWGRNAFETCHYLPLNLFNFMRLFLTLFDRIGDLWSNDQETFAGFTGAGCFNWSVQSKPVRPVRNFAGIIFERFDGRIFFVKRSQLISWTIHVFF